MCARVPRRVVVLALAALLLVESAMVGNVAAFDAQNPARPNIVVVLTDDQRWDSLDQMPQLDTAPGWAHFTNAFVDEPMCCPSRASILTGRYPQHTGVETNLDGAKLDERRTVATMLHTAGYRTGLFGKYLNGFPFGRRRFVPSGWDRFVVFTGAYSYFHYKLNVDGRRTVNYGSKPKDYSTDVLAAMGRRFIDDTKPSQPLFLYLAPNVPHWDSEGRIVPAPRDRDRCKDKQFPEPPNFNAYDTVSEPAWMSTEVPVSAYNMTIERKNTCAALGGVDDALASIMSELKRVGRLKNTYVIFTSDNGFAFGEHRLIGKGDLYEASIRVPLLVRGPNIRGGTIERLTSNVDFVPTILDWAHVSAPPDFIDGASFAGDLRGDTRREPQEILLRGCRTGRDGDKGCGGNRSDMGFNWGLRTKTYKYVEYPDGYVQLFDLTRDPWELTNLAGDPARGPLLDELHARLEAAQAP